MKASAFKYFVVIVALLAMTLPVFAAGDFIVIVDAGHGGKDPGCTGKKCLEKNVTLDVARRLAQRINNELPGVRALMTRTGDRTMELGERASFANRNNGQLFISIHVNSVDEKTKNRASIKGAQVYSAPLHMITKNFDIIARHSAITEIEKGGRRVSRKYNARSVESKLVFELTQEGNYEESTRFASLAQQHLINDAGRADKGVLQASYYVLWAVDMPSVLVELDFMCNPAQEAFLNSEEGRRKCADALFNALREFMK